MERIVSNQKQHNTTVIYKQIEDRCKKKLLDFSASAFFSIHFLEMYITCYPYEHFSF